MSKVLLNKLTILLDSGVLLDYVDNSLAFAQVLAKIGYANKGQYVSIIRQFLSDNDVDTSHFTANGRPSSRELRKCPICSKSFSTTPSEDQKTCSYSCSNTFFRSNESNPNWVNGEQTYRVRALKAYDAKCNRCGILDEEVLVVHHKDHNRSNNTISNLEVLCANCHIKEHKSTSFSVV